MTRHTILGASTLICDFTRLPTCTEIPVRVHGTKEERNGPIRHASDWAIAKYGAKNPETIDEAAGITVPACPNVEMLSHIGPRRSNSVTVRAFLNALHDSWVEARDRGYKYSAYVVQHRGFGVELLCKSNEALGILTARQRIVFDNIKCDEKLVCYYNTPADPGGVDQPRNDCVTDLLKDAGCSDLAVGNAVLVRASILHDCPLGLNPSVLRSMLKDRAPKTHLPAVRHRNRAAEEARKRRKRAEDAVEGAVELEPGEFRAVRLSVDTINPFSLVVLSENHLTDLLETVLLWKGEFAEFPVRMVDADHELVVITADVSDPGEVRVRRTSEDEEVYGINTTARRLFPGVPAEALNGPVVIGLRNVQTREFKSLSLSSFRKDLRLG